MENNNSKTIADNGLNNGFFKNLFKKKTPDEIMENDLPKMLKELSEMANS